MFERIGFKQKDKRNLGLVMGIVAMVMFAVAGGHIFVRSVVAGIGALVSGVVFILMTLVLNRYRPGY